MTSSDRLIASDGIARCACEQTRHSLDNPNAPSSHTAANSLSYAQREHPCDSTTHTSAAISRTMMAPSKQHGSGGGGSGGLSSRRQLRMLVLFLLACPLMIYALHSMFGAYSSNQRAQCALEMSAVHTLYKERLARVLADLHLQVSKETALLKSITLKEREALNAESGLQSAEATAKELTARVNALEQELAAANAATAQATATAAATQKQLEELQARMETVDAEAAAATATPLAPVPTPPAPAAVAVVVPHLSVAEAAVPRSGSVEVRPINQLLAHNAEQKAAAAAAAAFDTPVPETTRAAAGLAEDENSDRNAAAPAATKTPTTTALPTAVPVAAPAVEAHPAATTHALMPLTSVAPVEPAAAAEEETVATKELHALQAIAKVLAPPPPSAAPAATPLAQAPAAAGAAVAAPPVATTPGATKVSSSLHASVLPGSAALTPAVSAKAAAAAGTADPLAAAPAAASSPLTSAGAGAEDALPALPGSELSNLESAQANDPEIKQAEEAIQRLEVAPEESAEAEAQEATTEQDAPLAGAAAEGKDAAAAAAAVAAVGKGVEVAPSAALAAATPLILNATAALHPKRVHHHQILKDSAPLGTPVVVLAKAGAGGGVGLLRATLASLLAHQPPNGSPIFVSILDEDPQSSPPAPAAAAATNDDQTTGTATTATAATAAATNEHLAELLAAHKGKIHVLHYRHTAQQHQQQQAVADNAAADKAQVTPRLSLLHSSSSSSSASLAHLRFVLEELFSYLSYDHLVLLSAGHEVSPDFFAYFSAMEPVLDRDSASLWAVAGFNPQGQRRFLGGAGAAGGGANQTVRTSGAAKEVLRTEIFSGARGSYTLDSASSHPSVSSDDGDLALGLMVRKELWVDEWREAWSAGVVVGVGAELSTSTPTATASTATARTAVGNSGGGNGVVMSSWDEWVQSPLVTKGRDCIFPEVSRLVPTLISIDPTTTIAAGAPAAAAASAAAPVSSPLQFELHASKMSWDVGSGAPDRFDYLLGSNYPDHLAAVMASASTSASATSATASAATAAAAATATTATSQPSRDRVLVDHLPFDRELRAWAKQRQSNWTRAQADAVAAALATASSDSLTVPVTTAGEDPTSAASKTKESAAASVALLLRDQEVVVRYKSVEKLRSMIGESHSPPRPANASSALALRARIKFPLAPSVDPSLSRFCVLCSVCVCVVFVLCAATLGLSTVSTAGGVGGGVVGLPRCLFHGSLSYRRLGHRVWIAPDSDTATNLIEQLHAQAATATTTSTSSSNQPQPKPAAAAAKAPPAAPPVAPARQGASPGAIRARGRPAKRP